MRNYWRTRKLAERYEALHDCANRGERQLHNQTRPNRGIEQDCVGTAETAACTSEFQIVVQSSPVRGDNSSALSPHHSPTSCSTVTVFPPAVLSTPSAQYILFDCQRRDLYVLLVLDNKLSFYPLLTSGLHKLSHGRQCRLSTPITRLSTVTLIMAHLHRICLQRCCSQRPPQRPASHIHLMNLSTEDVLLFRDDE